MTKKPAWRDYFDALIVAVILALVLRTFVVHAYQIPSASMLNTLLIGDRLLVNKLSYHVKVPFTNIIIFETFDPEHGEVVVFDYPVDPKLNYIKRVIGVPGDVLEMRNKTLYRNNAVVNEPYVRHSGQRTRLDNFGPLTVPAGKYFMMGDNRDNSADSREWGFVDRNLIHGQAWRIYWSWGEGKPGDSGDTDYPTDELRWGRIGQLVE